MKTDERLMNLERLLQDIKEVNKMIDLHASTPMDDVSEFMLHQYKSKRENLIGYLIDELLAPSVRSPKSFFIIQKLLANQYPDLMSDATNDSSHSYLEQLELLIA